MWMSLEILTHFKWILRLNLPLKCNSKRHKHKICHAGCPHQYCDYHFVAKDQDVVLYIKNYNILCWNSMYPQLLCELNCAELCCAVLCCVMYRNLVCHERNKTYNYEWSSVCCIIIWYICLFFVSDDWKTHVPYTNILWIRYLVDKILNVKQYRMKSSTFQRNMRSFIRRVLSYDSALNAVFDDALGLEVSRFQNQKSGISASREHLHGENIRQLHVNIWIEKF